MPRDDTTLPTRTEGETAPWSIAEATRAAVAARRARREAQDSLKDGMIRCGDLALEYARDGDDPARPHHKRQARIEKRKERAFADLGEWVTACKFEKDGDSQLLQLSPAAPARQMTREWYTSLPFATDQLCDCWLPLALARVWRAAFWRTASGGFDSLTAALADHFGKPFAELPSAIQDRIRRCLPLLVMPIGWFGDPADAPSSMGLLWDERGWRHQLAAAEDWDWENDPTPAADRFQLEFWQREGPIRLGELQRTIAAQKATGADDDQCQQEIVQLWEKHRAVATLLHGIEAADLSALPAALAAFREPCNQAALGEAAIRLETELAGMPGVAQPAGAIGRGVTTTRKSVPRETICKWVAAYVEEIRPGQKVNRDEFVSQCQTGTRCTRLTARNAYRDYLPATRKNVRGRPKRG